MNQGDIRKEVKRLSNLKQNKDVDESVLEAEAKVNLLVRSFNNTPLFSDTDEQKSACEKFRFYVSNYEITSLSDLDNLTSLVYNEIYESKIRTAINLASDDGKTSESLTKQLTSIQNQKISLRKQLNLESETDTEQDSAYKHIETLKKRFNIYIQEHKDEFTLWCKHCAKPLLIRKRVKDFDTYEHPWYAGRWFFNYEILKDVKDGKLSKEDAWRYMCCASKGGDYKPRFNKEICVDYIDYCLKHWDEIVSHFE